MKKIFLLFLSLLLFQILLNTAVSANNDFESQDEYLINNFCIGNVCIGDTVEDVKAKNKDCVLKINDSNTGYYLFDSLGHFLVEFSTKQDVKKKGAPVRYVMTSNPLYAFKPGNISLESKVSDLMVKYGKPEYISGPNGYVVSFEKWPIKESNKFNKYEVNTIVGVYNPKILDLFKYSGSMNEQEEMKILKSNPEGTIINTVEIFSDYYSSGEPIK